MENLDLVYQEASNSQSPTHSRPAERGSRQAIQTRPDHPNRVVSPSRGLPDNMQSRSRASLRQWQQGLRLLKEDQPDQSMRQSGPFLQNGVSLIRWTSGHPLQSQLLTSLCTYFKTGNYRLAPLMVTAQPLLINWETHPSTSARMKISLVSWIVSIEIDPKAGGVSPPGTSHWSCTS